jgi:hypothetical protein
MQRVFYAIATFAAALFILQSAWSCHDRTRAADRAERDAAWKIINEVTN